jgi:hypothetical protein
MLSGHLEQAVDLLVHVVHQEGSSRYTLITYSEFQSRFFEEEFNEVFSHFSTPLTDSHPSSKRVLWRILLVQAHILAALIKTFDSFLEHDRQMVHPVDAISIGCGSSGVTVPMGRARSGRWPGDGSCVRPGRVWV